MTRRYFARRCTASSRRAVPAIQVAPPFALPDRDAVYAIQDGVARATGPVAGWKVGRAHAHRRAQSARRCWPARW